MENGEYYWVTHKKLGGCEVGRLHGVPDDPQFSLTTGRTLPVSDFDIQVNIPKPKGHYVVRVDSPEETIRDRFAMAALTGIMANESAFSMLGSPTELAYRRADDMLTARVK